jgi:hypothetical protein
MRIKLEIPLYDIKIKFYFDYDLGNPIKKIKKKHNKKKLYNVRSKIDFYGIVIGEFIPNNKLIYVLIGKSKNGINVDTLTHEIYHLTTKIMKHNNFKFNKTDEPFANLNGKLNSMIMCELIKRKVKLYYPIETKKIKIK